MLQLVFARQKKNCYCVLINDFQISLVGSSQCRDLRFDGLSLPSRRSVLSFCEQILKKWTSVGLIQPVVWKMAAGVTTVAQLSSMIGRCFFNGRFFLLCPSCLRNWHIDLWIPFKKATDWMLFLLSRRKFLKDSYQNSDVFFRVKFGRKVSKSVRSTHLWVSESYGGFFA